MKKKSVNINVNSSLTVFSTTKKKKKADQTTVDLGHVCLTLEIFSSHYTHIFK